MMLVVHWVYNMSLSSINVNKNIFEYQTIFSWPAQTRFHLHLAKCILATVYFWIPNHLFYSFYANEVSNTARVMRLQDG